MMNFSLMCYQVQLMFTVQLLGRRFLGAGLGKCSIREQKLGGERGRRGWNCYCNFNVSLLL